MLDEIGDARDATLMIRWVMEPPSADGTDSADGPERAGVPDRAGGAGGLDDAHGLGSGNAVDFVYAQVRRGDRVDVPPDAEQIDIAADLSYGHRAILVAGAGADPGRTQDICRRHLGPITTSLNRNGVLHADRDEADRALAAMKRTALLDLATGVVMARLGLDPASARRALLVWSERTSTPIHRLTSSSMLDLLTEEALSPGAGGL